MQGSEFRIKKEENVDKNSKRNRYVDKNSKNDNNVDENSTFVYSSDNVYFMQSSDEQRTRFDIRPPAEINYLLWSMVHEMYHEVGECDLSS